MPNLHKIARYIFLVCVISVAGFLMQRLTRINHLSVSEKQVAADKLFYDPSAPLVIGNSSQTKNKQYLKCILEPTKPFCLSPSREKYDLFNYEYSGSPNVEIVESRLKNVTFEIQTHELHLHNLLYNFTSLMKSINVKAILIEPSMLFCLLSQSMKLNLVTRDIYPKRIMGSSSILTFAVTETDSKKFGERNFTKTLSSAGFRIVKVKDWVRSLDRSGGIPGISYESTHYFLIREDLAVHVVVLYRRNSYLWHPGLADSEVDFEGLIFVDQQIFEHFQLLSLDTDNTLADNIHIPSSVYFLTEIEASRFLACRNDSSSDIPFQNYHLLTSEQERAAVALRELKMALAPHTVSFWLWSRTLLGWFDSCNILQYSDTLQISITLKSIEGLNFIQLFADNEFMKIKNITLDSAFDYQLDCHGLLIEIYILHVEREGFWCRYTEGQNVYKLTYPVFEACSTDIWGQKVNVPCNPDLLSSAQKKQLAKVNDTTPIV